MLSVRLRGRAQTRGENGKEPKTTNTTTTTTNIVIIIISSSSSSIDSTTNSGSGSYARMTVMNWENGKEASLS
jgi:hypothetical protein